MITCNKDKMIGRLMMICKKDKMRKVANKVFSADYQSEISMRFWMLFTLLTRQPVARGAALAMAPGRLAAEG